ncbi:MAG: flippase-like domain-containing protein [Methylobacteriaceae bacterium]|nr:flippase-like domain-containing protein [Methylobacteriaceae bacterium]
MRPWLFLLALAGLCLAAALVAIYGAGEVAAAFVGAGWGLAAVVLARAVQIASAGLAWRVVTPPAPPVVPGRFIFLRFIRESINALLPVAQIGGDLIGARLLTFYGPSGGLAGASVIVDIFIQVTSQFLYTLLGFGILAALGGGSPLIASIGYGLLVAIPILFAFFLVQRAGGLRLIERLLMRLAARGQWPNLGPAPDLDTNIHRIYARPAALVLGFAIHLATWLFGTSEVWMVLAFMGHPVSMLQALAIESLGQAVKGAAFAVPGAYGIQEGGFVALCAVFGVPAQVALALSLAKRVPDVVIGLPGLLAWQGLEGHRLWRLRRRGMR